MDYIQLIEDNWAIVLTIIMIAPLIFAAWSRWNIRTLMFYGVAFASLVADGGFTERNIFLGLMLIPLIYVAWRKETIIMLSYATLMVALIVGI